jgi:hypothetical protein
MFKIYYLLACIFFHLLDIFHPFIRTVLCTLYLFHLFILSLVLFPACLICLWNDHVMCSDKSSPHVSRFSSRNWKAASPEYRSSAYPLLRTSALLSCCHKYTVHWSVNWSVVRPEKMSLAHLVRNWPHYMQSEKWLTSPQEPATGPYS